MHTKAVDVPLPLSTGAALAACIGPADQLGTPARAGAPMDASTSVDKPHASATTSQFGGDPTREQEVPYQEHRQGKAIPNEAAANQ